MGRIFASRNGDIYQHYHAAPRPQTGRGYLLQQHGGAAQVMRNDGIKAQLVGALRNANHTAKGIEDMGASLAQSINAHGDDRAAKEVGAAAFFEQLGVPEFIARKVARRRTFQEDGAALASAMNDLATYMDGGPNADYTVTPKGLRPPATNPELPKVVDAKGNEAPVAGEGAPPGKRTAFPLSWGIPSDPRRPDEASAPPPDEPSAPPASDVPPAGGDDMSSDDEGYATPDDELRAGVPTASSANGPVNVTTVPTQTIRDAAATLAPVANGISELSPEQRAQLLQAVQRDPGIIEMIRLKLLDWSDLIDMSDKENPTLKLEYIARLRTQLAAVAQEREIIDARNVMFRRQQRATAGFKSSTIGGPFGTNVKVYEGPKYAAARLPHPENSIRY